MEQNEQEKAFLKSINIEADINHIIDSGANDIRFVNLFERVLSKFKPYLIEQAKKDKLTFKECVQKIVDDAISKHGHSPIDGGNPIIDELEERAAEMYANQFIRVAPAEIKNLTDGEIKGAVDQYARDIRRHTPGRFSDKQIEESQTDFFSGLCWLKESIERGRFFIESNRATPAKVISDEEIEKRLHLVYPGWQSDGEFSSKVSAARSMAKWMREQLTKES